MQTIKKNPNRSPQRFLLLERPLQDAESLNVVQLFSSVNTVHRPSFGHGYLPGPCFRPSVGHGHSLEAC